MMRIGIWCAYGTTLEPTEGIGVFAHNLATALVGIERVERVILAVHRGDEPLVAPTVAAGGGRITTVAIGRSRWIDRWRWKSLRRRHRVLCDRLSGNDRIDADTRVKLENRRAAIERSIEDIFMRQPVCDTAAVDGCDVWLLPHVAVERPFASATVVVVHDMVPLRMPGVVKRSDVESFRRRSQRIVQKSTLVATMSRTIRDTDIVGLLGCPPEKVRVIGPAVPSDFATAATADEVIRRHPFAAGRFILYPAAFRPYKNHAGLVEALAELRRRGDVGTLLVFTGSASMPGGLREGIAHLGLEGRVHSLGTVERSVLAGLYRRAAMTIVPSLYEQGSFPVLEAIHWGCPAAASDIPALRESLASLGDAMVYFDPRSPQSIADAVERVLRDRDDIVSRQARAFQSLDSRSWDDVAREWLAVFDEAVAIRRRTE